MALQDYYLTLANEGTRASALTPTWVHFKLADGTDITPQPAITALANGQYIVSYDPVANGEALGLVDAGVSGWSDLDRYVDMLLAAPPLGAIAGTHPITIQFRDSAAAAVPLVRYSIVGVGSAVADASGNSQVGLDAGTYTVRAAPTSSVLFADASIVVSANGQVFTITGTASTVGPPSQPGLVVGYLDVYDGQGVLEPLAQVAFRLASDTVPAGESYPRKGFLVAADSTGRLEESFRPSTAYEGRRDEGVWTAFTTPASGTFALPGILGRKV